MTESYFEMVSGWLDDQQEEKTPLEQEVLADISPEGQHEKRLARYSSAKKRQESVSDYILTTLDSSGKGNLEKEYFDVRDCGSFLIFRHYYSVDVYKMIAGCTCKKHLLCALCATRRAAKYIAIYSQKVKAVTLDNNQGYDIVMITFTIKNGSDLEERFNHLLLSMADFLQKRRNALRKNPKTDTLLKHVVSAVYSYEITWNSVTEEWHPHCHMIGLIPKGSFKFDEIKEKNKRTGKRSKYFSPTELWVGLCSDWKSITVDSNVVDVRKIDKPGVEISEPATPVQEIGDNSLLKALVEVFKYALKMNDLDVERQVSVYETLKGRRLVGSFGALRGVHVSENLNDAPLEDAELPFIDLLYQYSGVSFGYQEIMRGQFDLEAAPHGMLDLKNRIKRNQKAGVPGHYSDRVDANNQIEADVKEWYSDPEREEKISSLPQPGFF